MMTTVSHTTTPSLELPYMPLETGRQSMSKHSTTIVCLSGNE